MIVLLSGTHMLGFTFLRQRGMGYFLITTAIPVALVLWRHRHGNKSLLFKEM
jgi:hypothetical protein